MTIYIIVYLIGTIILAGGALKAIKYGKREFELKRKKEKEETPNWDKERELQESIRQRKKYLTISLIALAIIYISLTFISFT